MLSSDVRNVQFVWVGWLLSKHEMWRDIERKSWGILKGLQCLLIILKLQIT